MQIVWFAKVLGDHNCKAILPSHHNPNITAHIARRRVDERRVPYSIAELQAHIRIVRGYTLLGNLCLHQAFSHAPVPHCEVRRSHGKVHFVVDFTSRSGGASTAKCTSLRRAEALPPTRTLVPLSRSSTNSLTESRGLIYSG